MGSAEQPTDDTLDHARAATYGELVMAAYKMYENDPTKLTPKPCCIPAGYKFHAWVQMQDFFFGETNWKFYGILAVNTSETNKYVLAIRGTEGWEEWFDDFVSTMILVPLNDFGKVGDGFLKIYQTLRVVCPLTGEDQGGESLEREGSFAKQVAAAIRRCTAEPSNVVLTGHSLGGALATLYVADHIAVQPSGITIPLICTFASPKVGDYDFAVKFNDLGVTSWRIVDEPDPIPMLPLVGFYHVQTEYPFSSLSFVVWTPACFHYLETYLHWLDSNQQLKPCCVRPSAVRTAQLRSRAALSAPTQKEIVLSMPHEAGTTINITIKIE
jgi:Lipase (class 3)